MLLQCLSLQKNRYKHVIYIYYISTRWYKNINEMENIWKFLYALYSLYRMHMVIYGDIYIKERGAGWKVASAKKAAINMSLNFMKIELRKKREDEKFFMRYF